MSSRQWFGHNDCLAYLLRFVFECSNQTLFYISELSFQLSWPSHYKIPVMLWPDQKINLSGILFFGQVSDWTVTFLEPIFHAHRWTRNLLVTDDVDFQNFHVILSVRVGRQWDEDSFEAVLWLISAEDANSELFLSYHLAAKFQWNTGCNKRYLASGVKKRPRLQSWGFAGAKKRDGLEHYARLVVIARSRPQAYRRTSDGVLVYFLHMNITSFSWKQQHFLLNRAAVTLISPGEIGWVSRSIFVIWLVKIASSANQNVGRLCHRTLLTAANSTS